MDFFDDLTAAVQRDGARRGVRVAGDEWQKFMNRVEKAVPDSPQEAVAPVAIALASRPSSSSC